MLSAYLARSVECISMVEFLIRSPFRVEGHFWWLAKVYAILWRLWSKRNNRTFKGLRDLKRGFEPYEVSCLSLGFL